MLAVEVVPTRPDDSGREVDLGKWTGPARGWRPNGRKAGFTAGGWTACGAQY